MSQELSFLKLNFIIYLLLFLGLAGSLSNMTLLGIHMKIRDKLVDPTGIEIANSVLFLLLLLTQEFFFVIFCWWILECPSYSFLFLLLLRSLEGMASSLRSLILNCFFHSFLSVGCTVTTGVNCTEQRDFSLALELSLAWDWLFWRDFWLSLVSGLYNAIWIRWFLVYM